MEFSSESHERTNDHKRRGVYIFVFADVVVLEMLWLVLWLALLCRATEEERRQQPYGGVPCEAGSCRPSFLIIGVGKCGTSSLYYYLVGHPKVVGASQKQLQWFDHQYHGNRFGREYLSHFRKSLGPGEMSGEASPGYAAYSQVPARVARHLPGVRILVIVRDPAARAYSAYHYNYLSVVSKSKALSFFDLADAEMKFLRDKCGVNDKDMMDLSSQCYGSHDAESQAGEIARRRVEGNFPRGQHPSLPRQNAHLWRQLLGRSLYALYLAHWYAFFPKEDIFVVCSERLGSEDSAPTELRAVADFLGLDDFDFKDVVKLGKYNAGSSHKGYQALTTWDNLPKRAPMPPDARRLIDHFAKPFNDRLHANMLQRPCPNWSLSDQEGQGKNANLTQDDTRQPSSSLSSSSSSGEFKMMS